MTAAFSPCGTWRYLLQRDFPEGQGTLNFVMLNPSTADAVRNDPTIRRCIGYAQRWGYRRLLVTNLFALRATQPHTLAAAPDPVGPENDAFILEAARAAQRIVVAWGNHGALHARDRQVLDLLSGIPLTHLGMTLHGRPRHPLYVRTDARCDPFPLPQVDGGPLPGSTSAQRREVPASAAAAAHNQRVVVQSGAGSR